MITTSPVSVNVASTSLAGLRRPNNEDSVLARWPVFVVADGMGGHDAGDKASAIVVAELSTLTSPVSVEQVHAALHRARSQIDALPGRRGAYAAGTTVSGIVLIEQAGLPYWLVINLGDSRTYRMVDGVVAQISVDHSEVQHLVETGQLAPEQARQYPRRNVVTRILGAGTVECPDYWMIPVEAAERWMVCSDGVTAEVPDAAITETIARAPNPQAAVDALVGAALAAGGRDNISVIVVDAIRSEVEADEVTLGGFSSGAESKVW